MDRKLVKILIANCQFEIGQHLDRKLAKFSMENWTNFLSKIGQNFYRKLDKILITNSQYEIGQNFYRKLFENFYRKFLLKNRYCQKSTTKNGNIGKKIYFFEMIVKKHNCSGKIKILAIKVLVKAQNIGQEFNFVKIKTFKAF